MSFWKVLGGAAVGIVAVVALPVAGPIGAITAIGAAVAGTVGAAAGAGAAMLDDSKEQAERIGREKATAEFNAKYSKLLSAFEEAESQLNESNAHFNLIIAMTAVGIACANCDGEISPSEMDDINGFIAGVSASSLPKNVKDKLEHLRNNPPNIHTAYALAQEVGLNTFRLFNEIIEVVMHSDGIIHEKEEEFFEAWMQLASA